MFRPVVEVDPEPDDVLVVVAIVDVVAVVVAVPGRH
jgi:hypothetical protein